MRKSNYLSCNHDFDCCSGSSNEVGERSMMRTVNILLISAANILPISSLNLVISLYSVPNSCLTIRSCDFVKTVSVSAASCMLCMSPTTHFSHKIVSLCHFQFSVCWEINWSLCPLFWGSMCYNRHRDGKSIWMATDLE